MATTNSYAPIVDDLYAYYGRNLIEELEPYSEHESHSTPIPSIHKEYKDSPVGILGAGIGGLYAALILESLGIKYKIIEASDRVGGRLFTHKFEKGGEFDYFDVGAMRFPDTNIMRRLFHLFNYKPLNQGDDGLKSHLIKYHFTPKNGNALMYFNDVREQKKGNESTGDFQWLGLGVGEKYMKATVGAIMNDVTQQFTDEIQRDLATPGRTVGWKKLMELNAYSARGYMSTLYRPSRNLGIPDASLPTTVVNWCETISSSTGSFDRSFSEMVLEELAFGKDQSGEVEWKCFRGGSQVLSNTVKKYLESKGGEIQTKSRVTSISFDKGRKVMNVGILKREEGKDEATTELFEDVISTLPLPCLRTLNLQESGMNFKQANALRQMTYGPAVKIGVLFKSAWWTTGKDRDGKDINIFGGQSSTDRPVRMIVYPSHGDGTSCTLMASYCWTEDAQRFGALMATGEKEFEDQIKDMVIKDLALVHNVTEKFLNDEYVEHFAWSWHQPRFMGAFAFFGPGMFEEPYKHLNLPAADGHLHFAGEALSVRHAWVVGALDSAWRAVKEVVLLRYGPNDGKYQKFKDTWGENQEWRGKVSGFIGGGEPGPDLLLRHMHIGARGLFEH